MCVPETGRKGSERGVCAVLFFFQETIFRIVAAILHLGNVNFKAGRDSDSSAIADDKSGFHLETVAELLR